MAFIISYVVIIILTYYLTTIILLRYRIVYDKKEIKKEFSRSTFASSKLELVLLLNPLRNGRIIKDNKIIKYDVVGNYCLYQDGSKVIHININQTYEQVARALIHEMAHANYNEKHHLELGKKLPVPEFSNHTEKDKIE